MLAYIDTRQVFSWFNKLFAPTLHNHEQRITALEAGGGGGGGSSLLSASLVSAHMQTALSSTPLQLLFDTTEWEDGGHYFDLITPYAISIPVDAKYMVHVSCEFSMNNQGFRRITIRKNGSDEYTYDCHPLSNTEATHVNISHAMSLTSTDSLEIWAYHTSSATLTINNLRTQIFNIS